jgi:hypothetical protein
MNASIAPGLIPAKPGIEKEEPELAQEDDIPRDERPEAADEPERDKPEEREERD